MQSVHVLKHKVCTKTARRTFPRGSSLWTIRKNMIGLASHSVFQLRDLNLVYIYIDTSWLAFNYYLCQFPTNRINPFTLRAYTCGCKALHTMHAHYTLHPMYYAPVIVSKRMDLTQPTLWCCNKMAACDITTSLACQPLHPRSEGLFHLCNFFVYSGRS